MAESIGRKLSQRSSASRRVAGAKPLRLAWGSGAALAVVGICLFAVVEKPSREPALAVVDSVGVNPAGAKAGSVPQAALVDRAARTVLGTKTVAKTTTIEEDRVAMSNSVDDGIRTKGGEIHRLHIHLKRANGGAATALRDGDTVSKAATVQVSLARGARIWAAVVSVDGAGQATLHLPEAGDSAIEAGDEIVAPHSFQLDEAPGFERFFLIRSSRRFSLDEALALARRSGIATAARPGWNLESIRVVKP
jgi:hypothetical protein